MRRVRNPFLLAAGVAILPLVLSGCSGGEGSHSHAYDSPEERPTVAVTAWTDRTELFMEYPVLVAGKTGRAAIHVTDLSNFSPLSSGEAVVVLRGTDGAEARFRGGVSRPGIFGADVTPTTAGEFDMHIRVETADLQDVHELGAVRVLEAGAPIPGEPDDDGGGISFLKEQQWKLEFGTELVSVRALQSSLVVPAMVEPRAGGEAVLSAPVPGRVDPSAAVPIPGARVRAGDVLARIVPHSEQLHDPAGLRAALIDAEQEHELAARERDRAARLVREGVLPEIELAEAEAEVTMAEAGLRAARERLERLDTLSESGAAASGGDWYVIRAPFDAVVAEVSFASAASVEEGDEILHLVDTSTVHVVGGVPESRVSSLRDIGGAELLREGEPALPLGAAAATGGVIDPSTRTVEVRYALDNTEHRIPVGMAVRLRLLLGEAKGLPAVPESALVDDGGRPVIFVQTGGESFERRPVRLGNREGGHVHVLEGVEPGERVVSRGAYLIRLAAMSTQIPAHGHVH